MLADRIAWQAFIAPKIEFVLRWQAGQAGMDGNLCQD
jgi:hypothetical protein